MGKMLKRGDIAGVLAIFQKLKESGTAKNLHYNVAMSALASARDWKSAGALFDELDARGETDTYSYGAYSSALCRAGKLKEAVALVDHMSSRQVVSASFLILKRKQ
jgi:pentatricopeptide repeat protein